MSRTCYPEQGAGGLVPAFWAGRTGWVGDRLLLPEPPLLNPLTALLTHIEGASLQQHLVLK